MKVVTPVAMTSAMLVADSVPEADAPEWSAVTTYVAGAIVMRVATHRRYQAAAGSTGVDPATDATAASWVDIGPTNRWAMFDQVVGTATTATGSIDLTIAPGAVNALAVLETNADTVRVIGRVNGLVVYDRTVSSNPSGSVIDDWLDYAALPAKKLGTLLFDDVFYYPTAQLEVIVTGPDAAGPVTVGTLLVGQLSDLGSTEVGAEPGILDFSKKTTDDFGVTTVVPRAYSKRVTAKSMIDTGLVDATQRLLAALRATPALWIIEYGYDALAIYGFFKDFSIDLQVGLDPVTGTGGVSYLSVTIEGLT